MDCYYKNIKVGLFLLCSFLVGAKDIHAQSVQQGIVMEYHDKAPKTPLDNVAISVTNAGSTISDAKGQFTLNFRTLKAGDNIQFRRIDKAGYEVMNREALDVMRIGSKNTDAPLGIVLCRTSLLNEIRDGYRSVTVARYDKQLKQAEAEVKRLKAEGKLKEEEYNVRLDEIEAEYDEKLSSVDSYIDRFARIDLNELDSTETQIINLVKGGKFEEALRLYEEQGIVEKLRKSKVQLKQLGEAKSSIESAINTKDEEVEHLRQSIDRQITLLQMAGGKENMDKVHEILHEVFMADESNVEARKNYANSLHNRRENVAAFNLLNEGIELTTDSFEKALLSGDISYYYTLVNNHELAQKFAIQTISHAEPIKEQNPIVRSRILPGMYYSLLNAYMSNEELDRCPAIIQQIEADCQPDSLSFQSLVIYCRLLSSMNEYYSLTANHERLISTVESSIGLNEYIYSKKPWVSDIFKVYSTAATTYQFEGLNDLAKKYALLAVLRYNELIDKTPIFSYLLDARTVYYTALDVLTDIGEYAEAENVVEMMRERRIFEKLIEGGDPTAKEYERQILLAESLIKLHHDDVASAKALVDKACEDAQDDQLIMQRNAYMGMILQREGKYTEAEEQFKQAIETARQINDEDQDAWSADTYSRYLTLYADLLGEMGKKGACKKMLKSANQIASFACDKLKIDAVKQKYTIK